LPEWGESAILALDGQDDGSAGPPHLSMHNVFARLPKPRTSTDTAPWRGNEAAFAIQ
jgi:hypothetical protein